MSSKLTDLDYAEAMKKWKYHINVTTATDEDIGSYIQMRIKEYTIGDKMDRDLWELMIDDFKDFNMEVISRPRKGHIQELRYFLRDRGVFVSMSKNIILAKCLVNAFKEEEEHEWTDNEVQEGLKLLKSENFASLKLSRYVKARGLQISSALVAPTLAATTSAVATPPTQAPAPAQTTSSTPSQPVTSPDDYQYQVSLATTQAMNLATGTTHNKEVAAVAKLYTEGDKYGGIDDSFDFKLKIFYDICMRSGLPPPGYAYAFPTMLKGLARDHYYNHDLTGRAFDQVCNHLRNFFEGPGYHRKNLDKWNAVNLASIIQENTDKSTSECLQLLITKLRSLQHQIAPALRGIEFFHNKLVMACQGVPACRIAISKPSADFGELVGDLQSSIAAYDKEMNQSSTYLTDESAAWFTDRKFHRRNDYQSRDRHDRPPRQPYQRFRSSRPKRQCYVCHKEDCRSWNHSEEERERSKAKYKSRFTNDSTRKFNDRFKQYVTECEGGEDDDFERAIKDMAALTVDISDSEPDTEKPAGPTNDTNYFTSFGELSFYNASSTAMELANRAFAHAMTAADSSDLSTPSLRSPDVDPFMYTAKTTSRYTSTVFMGLMVDTGASRRSTAGYNQFQALQKLDRTVQLDTTTKGMANVQFGIGSTRSIGSTHIKTPIGIIEFHVLHCDTPFLLCLADMDSLQVYFNNLENVLVTSHGPVPVVRRFGHPFVLWDFSLEAFIFESFDQNPCNLTDVELHRLHRRFGHPSVERLQKVLDRSGHEVDKKTLEYLTKYCHYCQKHGRSPGRFRFTLREDVNFNYCIVVDVMYIHGSPVLHIVDEGTRFQAGRFLQNTTAKHTWDVLRMCWIDTYLGPPDLITHDAGKNFISKEFKEYTTTMGISTKAVPVEAHNSIGMGERYHGPLRRIYQIITVELPGIDKEMALQMSFKAINDTAGPDGLVPTLLVFGAYPRMTDSDAPSPTVTQRANAMRKAMEEVRKVRAERQVADALNLRNGPKTDAIHGLPPNSPVLVWREGNTGQAGHWDGPFNLLTVEGETCTLQMPHGPTPFRATSVKPYLITKPAEVIASSPDVPVAESLAPQLEATNSRSTTQEPSVAPAKRGRGRPRKYPILNNFADISIYLQDDSDKSAETHQFKDSRKKEIMGLLEKGVFEIVDIEDIPQGTRIFNSRFVDEIKNSGTHKAFEKSRLVVQAYADQGKDLVLTQSPTIQRVSQRLILCITAIMQDENTKLYLRDISQAYVQSTTTLNRSFYVNPPQELTTELGIPQSSILKVVKPLYGVPEAGNHWFKTYHAHHTQNLAMDQSSYDPCLLYSNQPFGIVGLQTDDTLFLADTIFAASEQDELGKAQFLAKDREFLTTSTPIKFNGGMVNLLEDGSVILTQERQCQNLSTVKLKDVASTTSARGATRKALTPKDQYVAQRARGAYIASMCQPEASFDLSFAAQVSNPGENDAKLLNKRLQWQMDNATRGLKFVKLDIKTLRLLVFTDASFANNVDFSSQIGFIIAIADATSKANIIHWTSIKCKRVTRSVLASELYAMAHGFDIGAAIKSTVEKLLDIDLPLIICIDSKSLYDCLVRLGTTQEKRLMIDVMCLRQSYERREIAEVKWINGDSNPADSMTKNKATTALQQLIDTNHIELDAIGWVERGGE